MKSLQEGRGPIVPVMLAPLVLVLAIGLYFAFEGRGSAAPDEAAAEVACGARRRGRQGARGARGAPGIQGAQGAQG